MSKQKRGSGRPGSTAALAVAVVAAALVIFYARGGFSLLTHLLRR